MHPNGIRPSVGTDGAFPENDYPFSSEYAPSRPHLQGWARSTFERVCSREARCRGRGVAGAAAANPQSVGRGPEIHEQEAGERQSSRRETSPPGWPHEFRPSPPASHQVSRWCGYLYRFPSGPCHSHFSTPFSTPSRGYRKSHNLNRPADPPALPRDQGPARLSEPPQSGR